MGAHASQLHLATEKHGEGILEFHAINAEPFFTRRLCVWTPLWTGAALVVYYLLGVISIDVAPWLWLVLMVLLAVQRAGMMKAESLLVVHDLGIQVKRRRYSGRLDQIFVERSRIEDVVINEGVGYTAVTYYIAFLVKGEREMLLAFQDLIPRIHDLQTVLSGARAVIFAEEQLSEARARSTPLLPPLLFEPAEHACPSILPRDALPARPGARRRGAEGAAAVQGKLKTIASPNPPGREAPEGGARDARGDLPGEAGGFLAAPPAASARRALWEIDRGA